MKPGRSSDGCFVAGRFLRWIVPAIGILLAVAGSGDSVGSGPATSSGVQVTMSVPFVRESIDEIRALAPLRERTVPENRAIPFHRIPREPGTTGQEELPSADPALAAPLETSYPAPSAPVLDRSFAGLGNPPHGEDVIPPDTMGAVGPNHLVSLLNSDFGVFDKTTGAVLQQTSLQSFWASLDNATVQPADFPFDTKVLYDPPSDRFFAVTLGGTNSPDSWILVAVSSTSDPTGAWDKWAIDADLDNNVQSNDNWADFPGVGLDANNLYVSANMFSNLDDFQYSKIWVLPKAQLLAGSPIITWTEFPEPLGSSSSMQPAHTFGSAPAEYFLFEGAANRLSMAWMDNTSGAPVWHPPVQVVVTPYFSSDSLPAATQFGNDNGIDTSNTRLLNVVYRNGALWTVHTVPSAGTTKTEVAWYKVNPAEGTVSAQGRISDPTRWYYYPSIGVNQDNVAAIGFSGSSSREYAGGYYTIVRPSSGTADPVSLLKPGVAPYYKTGQTLGAGAGTDNRWGDYSATVVDPSDDTSFWTLQEYAESPVAGVSRWGTWWGKFHLSDVAAPSGLSATVGTGVQVTLAWTDSSANESGFRIERRTPPGGAYSVIGTVGQGITTFVDNTDTGLAQDTNYFYRVESFDAGGGSYSNEVFVTTTQIAPPGTGGGGGGGGCLSISRSGAEASFATSLFSAAILLLPACALGLRRISLRFARKPAFRHPAC